MDKYEEKRLREKIEVILPALNERQRRIFLAAEARSLRRGGVSAIAKVAGVARDTIYAGLRELEFPGSLEDAAETIREEGAGRKKSTAKQTGLVEALLRLVESSSRGDPMSPLCWTSKSTRQLAEALKTAGFSISYPLVAKVLKEQGFSLQANVKTREGASHEDRDAQFEHLNGKILEFQSQGQPTISVDTKKKELVGDFKNGGREWHEQGKPEKTRVHDFKDKVLGKAIPYGVYDIGKNTGWVNVGIDHDTATFAVESIRRWWTTMGRAVYPRATKLLITCDGGGSNASRNRLWKIELAGFAKEANLDITVCHLPPGTSKWNKIEHRLFSHITMNWRGRPLVSREVVVQLIGATKTRKGLKVDAVLDENTYPTGVVVTDEQLESLSIERHAFHGEWNYTLPGRFAA